MDRIYISNTALISAGLRIKVASSAVFQSSVAANYKIDGVIYAPTAATLDAPALTGVVVPINSTTPITVSVNQAGSFILTTGTNVLNATIVSTAPNAAAAAIALRTQFAEVPNGQALVGYVVIRAGATAFTGGTTALDAATYTTTYINTPMASTL